MKNIFYKFGCLILFSTLFTACNGEYENSSHDKVMKMGISNDEQVPNSIKDVIANSDLIVRGKFNEELEIINAIRDAHDPSKEGHDYQKGHIYDFTVYETYFTNNSEVSDSVNILLSSETQIDVVDEENNIEDQVIIPNLDFDKPDFDKEYIFFLYETNIEDGLYSNAHAIAQIEIDQSGELKFISDRIVGQLGENIDISSNNDEVHSLTEHRGVLNIDVKVESQLIDDILGDMKLEDLEEKIKK
ncbi:hypothetical protein [Salisediminibacterium selenitireducens]|uniref:Lipoprotein n=1 Tax=Bacillus selenitireducens (strain ATCC 700615 / DSM 15326 / MLS10) TaxID=439292 RepID=D6XYI2_BACIE|nr:hypothetical protein [Salisediminibacterium selenitireducens]ADI00251.1 hypothetical protein Bsel_2755 [[Bacillus] selenitireducens MLS10]